MFRFSNLQLIKKFDLIYTVLLEYFQYLEEILIPIRAPFQKGSSVKKHRKDSGAFEGCSSNWHLHSIMLDPFFSNNVATMLDLVAAIFHHINGNTRM
jgi:hypothetical protein